MLNSIICLIFYVNGFLFHDFHASVCDVEYDGKRKALEITHRIFLDDLEEALRKWSGNNKVDVINPTNKEQFQQMLGRYLLENFAIKVNNKQVSMNYLGSEMEDDVMYCYIDMVPVKKVKSLEVTNSILIQMFDDQINIVHVDIAEETKSLKLNKHNSTGTIDY